MFVSIFQIWWYWRSNGKVNKCFFFPSTHQCNKTFLAEKYDIKNNLVDINDHSNPILMFSSNIMRIVCSQNWFAEIGATWLSWGSQANRKDCWNKFRELWIWSDLRRCFEDPRLWVLVSNYFAAAKCDIKNKILLTSEINVIISSNIM